ncbi:hypothetical protein [Methylobacterium indicum]|uniref:hypothetical protein n=1 Tax=Methylobacterium indicum TaxID=1775910 RepID=UPI002435C543|nr:hypothetical protein [Methylobacterium indicum]
MGATAGGIAGGFVGGAVGSVFGPVGTVAGRFAGARVGQWGGRALGGYLASKMEDANEKAEPQGNASANADGKAKDNECAGSCKEQDDKEKRKAAERRAKEIHDNPEQFRGKDKADVEKQLDKELRDDAGWSKAPLKKGSGNRYISPNGNQQIRVNDGYPGGNNKGPSDPIHSGPYLNTPSTGTRVPLKGNPVLGSNNQI